jgi:hypothetical protein
MADDITLTVRVRDMTRGDFNRLDHQLDRMRRNLRGVSRDGESAGMHSQRLGDDINTLGERFKTLQRTGSMSRRELTHLRGSLDAMSRSALNAARSGEITHDRYRALDGEISSLRHQMAFLGRGLDGNTNRLRRHNNTVNTTVRSVNGLVRSVNTTGRTVHGNTRYINTFTRDLNRVGNTANHVTGNGKVMGGMFANLRQRFIGTAVVLGAGLLPTIGALAPMIAGIGAVAGVAALAFAGLHKPTKFLTKDEKEFLKSLKPVTQEFRNLQATARKAVLPQMSKAFGDVKKAVKALNPVMKVAGDTFGELFGKMARGIASKDFMGPFLTNVKMGTSWLMDFAKSFGTFTIKFFEFGTKSKPALDAWQNLLGGFLDTGLPGMFKNLEQGIGGSSDFLNGLADAINRGLLPALGNITGAFMKAFGPLLGKLLSVMGKLLDAIGIAFSGVLNKAQPLFDGLKAGFQGISLMLTPFKKIAVDSFKAMNEYMGIGLSVAKDLIKIIGGSLAEALIATFAGTDMSSFNGDLTHFAAWVKENQAAIRLAFVHMGIAMIEMVQGGVKAVPILVDAFVMLFKTVIDGAGTTLHALAALFKDVPVFGAKFKEASDKFDAGAGSWKDTLDGLSDKAHTFSREAGKNLERGKVVLNVQQAKASLDYIKHELDDPKLTKERKAKLEIEKAKAEADLRKAQDDLSAYDGRTTSATIDANASPFFDKFGRAEGKKLGKKTSLFDVAAGQFNSGLAAANRAKLRSKSAAISANPRSFWSQVGSLVNRTLGTSYINVQMRKVDSTASPHFGASGGKASSLPRKMFAGGGSIAGGVLDGPGTKKSDSLVARLSRGEFVMQASAVDKYGPSFMQDVNQGTYELPGFKKGGLTKKQKAAKAKAKKKAQADAEHQARTEATGSFHISHFGKMAGYKRDPIEHDLAIQDSLSGLVDSLNKWRGIILKAAHGATESKLLKALDSAGKKLIGYEKKLTKVNASLDKAKERLDSLKQASAALRDSVTSGVMSATNITRKSGDDKNLTVADLMSTMTESRDKSKAFSDALAGLRKKGVSSTIIQQIAEAGIEGGGLETAGTLMTASASEIATMNKMQKQINDSAKSAGKTAADAMYAAGIKAAEGLVAGLTKQKKSIEKAMMNIALAMEKAIKKALGIKSPSKVMQKVGHFTAEGFAVGIKKNRSKDSAWGSMLVTKSSSPAVSPYTGGGSGSPMILQVRIGDKVIDELWLDSGRRVVRTRGGNVQATLGRRSS